MKRKILSILLIIFMLSASLITIPVNAKILNEGDGSWAWSYEDVLEWSGDYVEYDTLDDYMNANYVNYANLNKSEITTLYILGQYGSIKDLSGLYDFINLEQLCIMNLDSVTQTALEAVNLNNLANMEELYLSEVDISNLAIGELNNLTFLEIDNSTTIKDSLNDYYIEIDLSNMNELEHFFYSVLLDYDMGDHERFSGEVSEYIKTDDYLEVYYDLNYETQTGDVQVIYSLIEVLDINVGTDKSSYALNTPVTCYVSWNRRMEASEFVLNFDSTKLEFVGADIGDDFYNSDYAFDGEISVAWAAFDEVEIDTIRFTFNTIEDGDAEISVIPFKFATGDLDTSFVYDANNTKNIITIETDYIKNDAAIKVVDVVGDDAITGLQLTDNKLVVQNLLDENVFDDGTTVKILNANKEEITDTSSNLGTGYYVQVYKDESLVRELRMMIYGDLDGDGEITAADALTLIKAKNNKISISDFCYTAGSVTSTGKSAPTAVDALAIIKHLNEKYVISQNY